MTCWNGHLPHMNNDQLHQAMHAYYRAAFTQAWDGRMRQQWWVPTGAERPEPAVEPEPRRSTSLPEARAVDKAGAIEVEFVRVR